MGPGKLFGELAILYNSTRTATVKAKSDTKVIISSVLIHLVMYMYLVLLISSSPLISFSFVLFYACTFYLSIYFFFLPSAITYSLTHISSLAHWLSHLFFSSPPSSLPHLPWSFTFSSPSLSSPLISTYPLNCDQLTVSGRNDLRSNPFNARTNIQ